jgi:acyl carrier protein
MTTIETLNQVFCMVFDDDTLQIAPEMTANDVDGWDSLSHINLIVVVEGRFGIRFQSHEVLSFKNIGDLIAAIDRKLLQ